MAEENTSFSKTTKVVGLISGLVIIAVPLFSISNNAAITTEAVKKLEPRMEKVEEKVEHVRIGQALLQQTVERLERKKEKDDRE